MLTTLCALLGRKGHVSQEWRRGMALTVVGDLFSCITFNITVFNFDTFPVGFMRWISQACVSEKLCQCFHK